ncbi:hypothetical protein CPAV1605_1082 [seawater metagenome]|uniref:Uncharacterized protein n=1 Tax=seawater metagenome TaxID=1561972 RepID=A0A5E8CJ90_9ZZZZ
MLIRFIKNIITKPKPQVMLGRWNTEHGLEIKNIMANYDHCGDTICKDPKQITLLVNKEIKNNLDKPKSKD